jgi:hypothetical protein
MKKVAGLQEVLVVREGTSERQLGIVSSISREETGYLVDTPGSAAKVIFCTAKFDCLETILGQPQSYG